MGAVGFDVDAHTAEVIASLRTAFGVRSNAAVLRKALALARIAAENADEDHTITVLGKNNETLQINLAE